MCGLLSSCSLPFIPSWTGCCLGKGPYLPAEPMFSFLAFVGLSAVDPTISLHRACYSFTFPLLCVTLWTCGLMFLPCQSTSWSIFCLRLPRLAFHIFTSFGLCWRTFLLCQPVSLFHSSGFLDPFTSFLPLLLPWAFCLILWASSAQLPHLYLLLLFSLIGL